MRDNSTFRKGLEQLNIELSDVQYEQFEDYYDILIEWNKVMNLTGITDYEEVIIKHFLDSLCVIKCKDILLFEKQFRILDMGTGAGFPGIPLKIAFPQHDFLLVDSLNKRINFLNTVIDKLKLQKIDAIHARAEELAHDNSYREQFDICVSRAVARLSLLSEYCIPFIKKGGYFIPYKSGSIQEEIDEGNYAIHTLSANIENTITFTLPSSDMERQLLLIRKHHRTDMQYPRSSAKISKNPLIKN